MTLSFCLAILIAGLFLTAVHLLFPKASLAWDPNSHDKLTSHALDLLAHLQTEPSDPNFDPLKEKGTTFTMLGWVLAESKRVPKDQSLRTAIEMQTRRGSVEEDMNSHLLNRAVFTWAEVNSLEGANGGYHFYCPMRDTKQGLSDSTLMLYLLGKLGSGCKPPMPSALIRATDWKNTYDPGYLENYFARNWHLDKEERNYTHDDALFYYRRGYSHLSFYTIGRVCHLLQDMAVPAHVRDDAHVGGCVQDVGFDPSDPLERYAEDTDRPTPFHSYPGEDSYYTELWSFRPQRSYSRHNVYKNATTAYSNNGLDIYDAFNTLATHTHKAWFSYNTIPQNVDSHDPVDPSSQPYRTAISADEMGNRCDIETDALWDMLQRIIDDAESLYRHANLFHMSVHTDHDPAHDMQTLKKIETIHSTFQRRLRKPLARSDADNRTIHTEAIIGLGCRYVPLDTASTLDILNAIPTWNDDATTILNTYDGTQEFGANFNMKICLTKAQQIVRFWESGIPDKLREILSQNKTISLQKALEELIFHSGLDLDTIRNWFYIKTNEGQYQGPFCLTEEILLQQYMKQQTRAVQYTASLLTNWFESIFDKEYPPLDVWLNVNTQQYENPQVLAPREACAPSATTFAATKWVTLAILDHLPIPLDLTMEISLEEEETDEDLLEQGIRLEINWELVLGQNMGTLPNALPEQTTYLTRATRSFLQSPVCQNASSHEIIPLDKKNPTHSATCTIAPYNLEALLRLILPTGEWSPEQTSMGGIRRQDEPDMLLPLEHRQADDPLNAKITTAILRIRPLDPVEKSPTEAP